MEVNLLVGLHADAGADEIAVAEDVVDAADGGPEFLVAQPRRGISRLFARIRSIPFVGDDRFGGVRRVFDDVVGFVHAAGFDGFDLGMDGEHGVAEAVEFGFGFAFRRLDHDGAGDGPGNGGRVKTVIHQTFGEVFDRDTFETF
jgi:hypothetical protein